MTRYTPERGYGLDLSGPEPVWRGKRPGWDWRFAGDGYGAMYGLAHDPPDRVEIAHGGLRVWIPRYRIDDYIKRGLIDPARRDDL